MTEKEVILSTICLFLVVLVFNIIVKGLDDKLQIQNVVTSVLTFGAITPIFILLNLRIRKHNQKAQHKIGNVGGK